MIESDECLQAIPKKLKIGAYDWTVVLDSTDEGLCGQANFADYRLRLWPANLTSPGHVVGILIHECLHVIFDNQGLTKLKRDKEEREEAIIGGFETGIVSLFRDNPRLLTWVKKWLR